MASAYIQGQPFLTAFDTSIKYASCIHDVVMANPDGEYLEVSRNGDVIRDSYMSMYRRSLAVAAGLGKYIKRDDPVIVVICLTGALDYIAAAWACLFSGFDVLSWPTDSAGRDKDSFVAGFESLADRLGNALFLTEEPIFTLLNKQLGSTHTTQLINFHNVTEHHQGEGDSSQRDSSATRASDLLIATSGTTGLPKLAVLDNRTVVNRFYHSHVLQATDVTVFCLPFHSVMGVRLLLPTSRKVIYMHPWRLISRPSELLSLIEHHAVSRLGLTSFYASLINEFIRENSCNYNLSKLRILSLGAETIVPSVLAELISNFQKCGMTDAEVILTYGMTESGPICQARTSDKAMYDAIGNGSDMLSLGSCVAGWDLRVVDDQGEVVEEGETGKIEIKSGSKLFKGYLEEHGGIAGGAGDDGWFYTGDLGRVQEGNVYIAGREKATVIVGARKIPCEQIEAPLRKVRGLHLKTIVAAGYRDDESVTDELAVFFVPETHDEEIITSISREIITITARTNALSIKHLVALKYDEISRTATGKIIRSDLLQKYRSGSWLNLCNRQMPYLYRSPSRDKPAVLKKHWMEVLELSEPPLEGDDFFSLGGDSLAAANLISRIETDLGVNIRLDSFYANPGYKSMQSLVQDSVKTGSPTAALLSRDIDGAALVEKLELVGKRWHGERVSDEGVIIGLNTSGSRPPLFWVFQVYQEFKSLSEELGPEQPLYGMRSTAGLISPRKLDEKLLSPLSARYAEELLSIAGSRPFFLGGNCQGGIVALAMAKWLAQRKRHAALLLLMEWSFRFTGYVDPVLFIYGQQSSALNWYKGKQTGSRKQLAGFPRHSMVSIPATHGQFFSGANVQALAALVRRQLANTITSAEKKIL